MSITRNHPQDIQDRTIRLWVDDERWENMLYGRTETREIVPGRHVVKAHNTLFGTSLEFEAAPGEEVRLRCANGLTGGGKLMVLMLGVAYLRVRLEQLPSARLGEVT
ncbi:MAG: hypothetical protein OEW19_00905 [Acidobacteriota bacterium]|nr:hypothetical protein [Acidobacteriota bacterium]